MAGISSCVLGAYCFFLPHTPPQKSQAGEGGSLLGLDFVVSLLKEPSFAIFHSRIFVDLHSACNSITHGRIPILNELKIGDAASLMTWGQGSEIFFMLLMPSVLPSAWA